MMNGGTKGDTLQFTELEKTNNNSNNTDVVCKQLKDWLLQRSTQAWITSFDLLSRKENKTKQVKFDEQDEDEYDAHTPNEVMVQTVLKEWYSTASAPERRKYYNNPKVAPLLLLFLTTLLPTVVGERKWLVMIKCKELVQRVKQGRKGKADARSANVSAWREAAEKWKDMSDEEHEAYLSRCLPHLVGFLRK